LLLSLAILSMYLMTNPHIGQTFYWLTGNVTYTLPLIFLTVAAGLAASLYNRIADQKKSFSAYWRSKEGVISLITGVVLFITASLNETHAFYQLLVLGLAFVLFVLVQG